MEKKKSLAGHGSYLCSVCSNTFISRSNLTRHMRNVHNKIIGVLECCGVRFSDKAALKNHTEICHHSNFECSECEKRFSSANKLQRHLLIHSKYKEFKCNLCEFETAYKYNLIAHLNSKKHGNASGEERCVAAQRTLKYKCKICCKGYRWTFSLPKHMERSHGVKARNKLKPSSYDYRTAWKKHLKRNLKAREYEGESIRPINAFGDSRSVEMNCNDVCDSSRDAETEVGTISVNHQLHCLHTMSKNTESPVDEKRYRIRKIEEKIPSHTSDSGCEESCYPMTTNHFENVDEMEIISNATIPSCSVEHTPPQRLSAYKSLPLPLLNPIHGEARQLRSHISLATSIPAVLSILERLLELSAIMTNQIRSSVKGELRSQTIECFEYLWSTSKMAVRRWEDMEGSINRNTFLRAVKYAYEMLPVFISLEINEHLEVVECVTVLIISTVKNCQQHQ